MSKSPSAEFHVARLPNQVGADPLSGAHQLPQVAFLAVRLTFLGEPVAGIVVAFHESDAEGKPAAKISKEGLATGPDGIAAHDETVAVGNYFCEITYAEKAENPPKVEITTVDEKRHPFEIDLPAGRPRRDFG